MTNTEVSTAEARKYTADEAVVRDLFPGVEIQFIHTPSVTFASWTFEPGGRVKAHKHPHEQITHCHTGVFVVEIEGEDVVLNAGDTVVIPGGVEHAARADEAASGVGADQPHHAAAFGAGPIGGDSDEINRDRAVQRPGQAPDGHQVRVRVVVQAGVVPVRVPLVVLVGADDPVDVAAVLLEPDA